MRIPAMLGLAFLAGCIAPPGPPQYMAEAIRGGELGARRALEQIEAELGPDFETRQILELFYLASNGGTGSLDSAEITIRRIVSELYLHFFSRRPTRPVRVYCFRNLTTYSAYVRSAYGRAPTTPYGFYMANERKMVLNLSTGQGTLAHEVVHPLIGEDFPGVPAWFNEGFASLFERTGRSAEGRMVPESNWRVRDLRRANTERREITLRTLMETNTDEFYGDDRGVNYATARYFCLYLHQLGLLERYYREFRSTAESDWTGITALEKVTRKTLGEFETGFRRWVATLWG